MFFITRYINKDGKMVSIKEAAPVASEEDNVTTSQTATDNADTGTDNAGDSANQQNTQTDDANTDNNAENQDDARGDTDISMDIDMNDDGTGNASEDDSDSSDDDSSGSSESTNDDEEVDENKKTEEEIFSNLTHDQLDIKHKELKNQYLNLYDMTTEIIDRISSIAISEDITFVIDYVSTTLSNLRDMVVDYINDVYKTKSYTENLINYNRFLATLNGINKILEEINKTSEK